MEMPTPRCCAARSTVVLLGLGELAGSFLSGQLHVRQFPVNFLQQAAVGFQDIVSLLELILLLEDLLLVRFFAADKVFTCARDPLGDRPGLPLALVEAASKAEGAAKLPTIANDLKAGTLPDAKLIGFTLFNQYGFHIQVVGLLLLVGTVGVVVLSKREKTSGGAA